jgi:hypothetical protein
VIGKLLRLFGYTGALPAKEADVLLSLFPNGMTLSMNIMLAQELQHLKKFAPFAMARERFLLTNQERLNSE